ncbi:alanine racemase [bacterium]|nr:alanine racemase [bacterium]
MAHPAATSVDPSTEYERFVRLLEGEPLPALMVDLDALDHNLKIILDRSAGTPVTIRLATKSIRCVEVLRYLLDAGGERVRGLMTYSARETAALADKGFDDLLTGYPIARADEAAVYADLAARGVRAIAMIDNLAHIDLLAAAAAAKNVTVPVCLDVDVSLRIPGDVHIGVRRSPVRDVEVALELARAVAKTSHLTLAGIMAYEAQVAGLPDLVPGKRVMEPAYRLIKGASIRLAKNRRRQIVEALRADGHEVSLVNGGGTGSVSSTSHDPTCTEITAGSGFYCSHLFDNYRNLPFRPAALFALAVERTSDADFVTCQGGGYIASGSAGEDRWPKVHLPQGLEPIALEGWGEVQTPFRVDPSTPRPTVGDPVICRHAKAGEVMERFNEVLFIRGDRVERRVPGYRGEGWSFY